MKERSVTTKLRALELLTNQLRELEREKEGERNMKEIGTASKRSRSKIESDWGRCRGDK